jgi:hypothetical protein
MRSWLNNAHIHAQLLIVLTLLNLVDFLTTKILVDKIGFIAEANQFLFWAMVTAGSVYAILWVKVVTVSFMWWIVNKLNHDHTLMSPSRLTVVLKVLVAVFFGLITWNFYRVFQELSFIPI